MGPAGNARGRPQIANQVGACRLRWTRNGGGVQALAADANTKITPSAEQLAALMGRMAAYTGKQITWEMALNSREKLVPDNLSWGMMLPITPQAVPGLTKFV